MAEAGGGGADDPAGRDVRYVWIRAALFVGFVAVATGLAVTVGIRDAAALKAAVSAAGPVAPAAFVVVYAAVTLAPVPKNVMSVLAGVLFGFAAGVASVLLAATLGALVAFWLGRRLGRDAVRRLTGARLSQVEALLSRRGVRSVLAVRLVPVLPFTAINYAAGLTSVRLRDYTVGTIMGLIPGTTVYVAVGAYGISPGSWPGLVSLAGLVVLTVAGVVLARRSRRSLTNRRTVSDRSL
jgi:uncharacterized membrane protein YdjX (TVP38/TMEM64 family)